MPARCALCATSGLSDAFPPCLAITQVRRRRLGCSAESGLAMMRLSVWVREGWGVSTVEAMDAF